MSVGQGATSAVLLTIPWRTITTMLLVLAGCATPTIAPAIPLAAAAPEPRLKIGDAAPAIDAMAWIRGAPVTGYLPGHVYVVEFWATWCAPCEAIMPHLSDLQRKHAGQITVIGVNVREADSGANTSVDAISAFVKKKDERMAYTVAMDDPARKTVFEAWMVAGGSYAIPTSFVVDGSGKLVWMGYPSVSTAAFDTAIEQALLGSSDLAAAWTMQTEINEENFESLQVQTIIRALKDAQQRKDYCSVITEADRLGAQSPQWAWEMFSAKLGALLQLDAIQGLKYAHATAQDIALRKNIGQTDNPQYWGAVGSVIAAEENLSKDTYELGLDYLQEAAATNTGNLSTWEAIARVHSRLGNLRQAIVAQEKALAIAGGNNKLPEHYLSGLEDQLAEYRTRNGTK